MFFSRPGGHRFVNRGALIDPDYEKEDFIIDESYHDLDLSSIIGKGKKLLLVRVLLQENAGGKKCSLRTKDFVGTSNITTLWTQVANDVVDRGEWVQTNSDGVIEYFFSTATWISIFVSVLGWFE